MIGQIAKFAFVGLVATITHLVVGFVLMRLLVEPYNANTIGFMIAFCVSFVGHKVFTFNAGKTPMRDPLLRYLFLAATGYVLHQALFFTLVAVVKTDPIFAMFIASICVAGLAFVAARLLVFRT